MKNHKVAQGEKIKKAQKQLKCYHVLSIDTIIYYMTIAL